MWTIGCGRLRELCLLARKQPRGSTSTDTYQCRRRVLLVQIILKPCNAALHIAVFGLHDFHENVRDDVGG